MAEYTGTQPTFLSDVFTTVNNALNTFVTKFSTDIASEIAPIVMSGLILSFMIIGIMAIRGLLNAPFKEVAWKMFFVSAVVSVALTAGVYQQYVIDVFITMPDDLISSIVAKSMGGNVQTGQGAATAIEQLYALGVYNAGLYTDQAGVSMTDGINFSPYIYALLVFAGTVLCCFMGTLWLFIAKIVLALMLAIGPIFIVALCWKPTEQYFYKWLSVILSTVITSVLVVAVFAIFSTFFKQNLEALEVTEDSANFLNAGVFFFVGLLCMGVLMQIPNYVSQLTGGAVGAVGTAMASMAGAAFGGARGAASGATGAVQGTIAAKNAAGAYQSARSGGNTTYQGNRQGQAGRWQAMKEARREYHGSKDTMRKGYSDYYRNNKSNTQKT